MAMVQSGISVVQYFSIKIRLAKEAGFDNVFQQLLAVWNGLDIEIREHIPEPDNATASRVQTRLAAMLLSDPMNALGWPRLKTPAPLVTREPTKAGATTPTTPRRTSANLPRVCKSLLHLTRLRLQLPTEDPQSGRKVSQAGRLVADPAQSVADNTWISSTTIIRMRLMPTAVPPRHSISTSCIREWARTHARR